MKLMRFWAIPIKERSMINWEKTGSNLVKEAADLELIPLEMQVVDKIIMKEM